MRVLCALFFLCGLLTSAVAQVEPIHIGDTLQISVWQDPKLDRQVVVGPDGMISYPLAGHIQAGGVTPQALENALRKRLQKNYNSHLDITVSLAAVNKEVDANARPQVYITGEVLKPGPYVIRPNTSVMQAIATAGGVGPFAASKRIQIYRQIDGKESVFLFDYSAYKAGTDTADNIDLRPGDVIIVPERGLLE